MFKLLGIKRLTPSQEEVFKKLFKTKIDIYTPSITFLNIKQKKDFVKICIEEKIYSSYEINVDYKYKKDYNKIPFLIYLTKEKAKENIRALKNEKKYTIKFSGLHFKKVCRRTLNNNIIFNNLINKAIENEWEDNPGIYFPPKANYWTMKKSKDLNFYKKPSSKTKTIGDKIKKGQKKYLKKFNIKEQISHFYPKLVFLDKMSLTNYLKKIQKIIKAEIKFGKEKVSRIEKEGFVLKDVSLFKYYKSKGFIFYLTKTQIKVLEESRKKGRSTLNIVFSINQLSKTYKEVIRVNSLMHYYKDFERFNQKQNSQKILAITDKPHEPQEILHLTENLEKDLIDFGDEEVADLIDLNTIIPNPPPSTQDILEEVETFPKKYKVLQNEDLIPTTTNPSTNGENILKNILNYPETKRLLGISLTSDLKDKIKNLNSEASFGLASILSSLLTTNRGKMSIYSISRNQLKEILEGFITTLSILLNPTQKY